MSLLNQKNKLRAQILDTEHLLSLVEGHALMSFTLNKKIEGLREKLAAIPENIKESRVVLLFSGKAVKGSQGIKAQFIGETIKPFQELIKTQTALIRYGKVGKRGKSKKSNISDLYLTALPTGSFGIELSQIDSSDFFAEEDVAEAIEQVINIVEAATSSDKDFEEILESTPSRNLNNLKRFLKLIDNEKSILKMESGTRHINISESEIHQAFQRVNAATKEDFEVFESGVLRGVLLEAAKFEFINNDGYKYTGLINTRLPESIVVSFLNKRCLVHLKKSKTHFISGNEKITFELIGINENVESI